MWCLGCSGCQVGWVVAGPHYSGPGNPVDGLKPAIKLGPDSCLSCLDREGYNKVAHNCSRFLTHLVDTLGLIKWIFFICSLSAFYGPVLSVARAGESAGVDTSIISLLIAGYPHLHLLHLRLSYSSVCGPSVIYGAEHFNQPSVALHEEALYMQLHIHCVRGRK